MLRITIVAKIISNAYRDSIPIYTLANFPRVKPEKPPIAPFALVIPYIAPLHSLLTVLLRMII